MKIEFIRQKKSLIIYEGSFPILNSVHSALYLSHSRYLYKLTQSRLPYGTQEVLLSAASFLT